MIGGSAVVAPDTPQAFGNILLYKDEVVRWLQVHCPTRCTSTAPP